MRFLTGRARTRQEVLEEWLPALSVGSGPDGVLGYWAGFCDERFTGWWALNPAPGDDRQAELGYRLCRAQWGRGLASEGALAVLGHGFDTVGLERIWAQTMAVNTASVAVMTRIGMHFVRTWVGQWNEPLPGWEEGEVEYALSREHWTRQRACSSLP